jgi:uncharacterized repeat protein (TIGR02543 family)
VNHGDRVVKPVDPVRSGYVFGGWYSGDNLWDFNNTVTGNLTLTAKWTTNAYTVTFTGENVSVSSQTVNHGDRVVKPADPVRTGYNFGGWYNGDNLWDFNNTVTGNLTLTAKWLTNAYLVTFTGENVSVSSQTVNHGDHVVKPADPVRTGYNFGGWYDEDKLWDFDTPLTGDLILVVRWETLSPFPIFDGLYGEYSVGAPTVSLKVKGAGSEKLTVFKVNGQVNSVFNPSMKGTFLIEALSVDGKIHLETYIIVK